MSWDDLVRRSDVLFLALPLTDATFHRCDARTLAAMKPGALVINAGRGSVVDERAMAAALGAGRLGGYAADVFEMEDMARPGRPAAIRAEVLGSDRTVLTPHLGSAVDEVRREIALLAAQNSLAVLRGDAPPTPSTVRIRPCGKCKCRVRATRAAAHRRSDGRAGRQVLPSPPVLDGAGEVRGRPVSRNFIGPRPAAPKRGSDAWTPGHAASELWSSSSSCRTRRRTWCKRALSVPLPQGRRPQPRRSGHAVCLSRKEECHAGPSMIGSRDHDTESNWQPGE